jgi:hypothetical protein
MIHIFQSFFFFFFFFADGDEVDVRFSFLDERGLVGLGVVIQGGWRFIFFTFGSWRWSVRW